MQLCICDGYFHIKKVIINSIRSWSILIYSNTYIFQHFIVIRNDCYHCVQPQKCGFNIANNRQKSYNWILQFIVNIIIYTTAISMIPFNACICNSSIKMIFIIAIIKINCIAYTFVMIIIIINHVISNVKRYEFVPLYNKQAMINFDIFI